ncbi:FixH family protein [Brevibacillus choshinensis]|uniref:FixH family protein n=1 Tax=Brevibacillus choshinensis TaxID=54911 RepID=A0ABX7FP26_BRECH|nr:FixH family protein [Brevibacillus choshinensis]QRG67981.1 FixH family protein [Brevibacillus choshinensis]
MKTNLHCRQAKFRMERSFSEYDMVLALRRESGDPLKRAFRLLVLLFAAILSLSACSSSHSGHPEASPPASKSGKLTLQEFSLPIHVYVQPDPPNILKESELHIVLPSDQADAWKNAKVSVTLSMPSMDHGNTQATAEYKETGEFVASIVPTMVGDWRADITFEKEDKSSTVSYVFAAEP